jgi:glycosyltransferase involved in cell wall biosynthesis
VSCHRSDVTGRRAADEMSEVFEPLPISVVIPAFDRADLVGHAVRSAWSQVPPPAEVIVVDDCSSDDTGVIAAKAGATVVVHSANQGEGQSRNSGVHAASSPWIAFLDSDDSWQPGHLAYLWAHRDDHVLVASAGRGSRDGRVYGHPGPKPKQFRTPVDVILPFNRATPSGVMVRNDVLTSAGGFRDLPYVVDLDAWIRVLELGTGVALPTVTFEYRQHDGQISANLDGMSRGLDRVVASYSGRAWWSWRVQLEAQAMPRWDQMMAALRARNWRQASGFAVSLLRPGRIAGLLRLLVVRQRFPRR